jgi:hypothetical protein
MNYTTSGDDGALVFKFGVETCNFQKSIVFWNQNCPAIFRTNKGRSPASQPPGKNPDLGTSCRESAAVEANQSPNVATFLGLLGYGSIKANLEIETVVEA